MSRGDRIRLEVNAGAGWVNIIGDSHDLTVRRGAADVGTLTGTVYSAALDPLTADTLRPGGDVRVMVDTGAGTWRSVYQGMLVDPAVTYLPAETGDKHVKITLSAVDNIGVAANMSQPAGVERIADLYPLLQPAALPYNINGHTQPPDPGAPVNTVAYNPNATLLDQLLLTRDTALGFVWVDATGRIQCWDNDTIDKSPVRTLGPDTYSALDVAFNPDDLINSVLVKWLRYDEDTNTTAPVTYGPYEDADSIAEWGRHQATFTIEGANETEAHMAAYAGRVLARAATAAARVGSLTIPIPDTDAGYSVAADLDVGAFIDVTRPNGTTETLRVSAIEATITPDPDPAGVQLHVTLDPPSAVAAPLRHATTNTRYLPEGIVKPDTLAADAVTARALADGSVTGDAIVQAAITAGKIAAGAVDTAALADDAVTGKKIIERAITDGKLADNAVIRRAIAAGVIGTKELIANAVTAGKIAADSIGTKHLIANAVTAGKIAADAVRARNIAANAVNTSQLAAGAITAKHTITGALIRTAKSGMRWEIDSKNKNRIRGFSGVTGEDVRGGLTLAQDTNPLGYITHRLILRPSSFKSDARNSVGIEMSKMVDPATGEVVANSRRFDVYCPNHIAFWKGPGKNGKVANIGDLIDGGFGFTGDVRATSLDFAFGGNIKGLDVGSGSYTSDSNGYIFIPHKLGKKPSVVIAVPGNDVSHNQYVLHAPTGDDAQQFRLRLRDKSDDSVVKNGSKNVAWIAIR